MAERYDVVVIGGGQAGLAISYYLTQQGLSHVVLEQGRVGESWRSARWDSFTLVTPNFMNQLPDFPHAGDPGRFLTRDEVVAYLNSYADHFASPLQCGVRVTGVAPDPTGGFRVQACDRTYTAANVVVATGTFQRPRIPAVASRLPSGIRQLHTSQYRNPDQLSSGAVLVVGSGQSGAQIAEELCESGRQVYLCVSRSTRTPRRYRGRDICWWSDRIGRYDNTVDTLPSPAARFAANPHSSGKNGGHEINLHALGEHGVVLLGRLEDVVGDRIILAPDLLANLRKADDAAANLLKAIDEFISKTGLDAPMPQDPPEATGLWHGEYPEVIRELDVHAAGIETIVWATGYQFDFGWVKAPVFDEYGYPMQERGVTACPGLYFLGLHWLHKMKSGLLYGVGEDAAYLATHIAGQHQTSR